MAHLWQELTSHQAMQILIPIGVMVLVAGLCLVLRKVLYYWLGRWAKKTKTELDDIILHSTNGASLLWCVAAGIYAGIRVSELPEVWMTIAGKVLAGLIILSIALALASLTSLLIASYARKSSMTVPMASLAQNVVRGIILLVGILILLDTFGVKITTLIAALGIGSLAIALALQSTLSDLFAGAYIMVGRKIRVGDYIKVDSGDEGYVVDIDWRATTIKPFQNTIVIIPNSKLSQAIVTNYNLPDPWIQVAIPINVSYDTDIERLERVLVEEGKRAIKEIPGMVTDFEPVVRFMPGFGDFSLNFVFVFRVKEFVDQYLVQHELRKRILKRFRQENIEIPFPIRTLQIHGNKAKSAGESIGEAYGADESKRAIS
jgi:small-conductance mechanosensitive channel